MAQISFIKKTYIFEQLERRFEPDYFEPRFLQLEQKLKTYPKTSVLKRIAQFSNGCAYSSYKFGSIGLPIAKIGDITNKRMPETWEKILPDEFARLNGEYVVDGDILMTLTGDPPDVGKTIIVEYLKEPVTYNQRTLKIQSKDKSNISNYALFAIISTEYIRMQVERVAKGIRQRNVGMEGIKSLIIPFPASIFNNLEILVKEHLKRANESKQCLEKANNIFLAAMGLAGWKATSAKTFARPFSAVQTSLRIDGEHFQPKFDEMLSLIRKNATYCKTIRSIKTFNSRGAQPKYFDDGTLKVINSQHILEAHLDYENFSLTQEKFWSTEKESRVFKNDILIYTTGANVGRANVYLEDERALASNHTNILRVKDENPIYVGFALNSIVGRMQTEKMKTGSAQAELYPSAINQFIVPFIDKKKQDEIAELYVASHQLSKRSKQLIEKAKRAVEIAIEKDEKAAIKWLATETGSIDGT